MSELKKSEIRALIAEKFRGCTEEDFEGGIGAGLAITQLDRIATALEMLALAHPPRLVKMMEEASSPDILRNTVLDIFKELQQQGYTKATARQKILDLIGEVGGPDK